MRGRGNQGHALRSFSRILALWRNTSFTPAWPAELLDSRNPIHPPWLNARRYEKVNEVYTVAVAGLTMHRCMAHAGQFVPFKASFLCLFGPRGMVKCPMQGVWTLLDRHVPGGTGLWKELGLAVAGAWIMVWTRTFFSNAGAEFSSDLLIYVAYWTRIISIMPTQWRDNSCS